MKHKSKDRNFQDRPVKSKIGDPNKAYLKHVQVQAGKMAELLGQEAAERYITEVLKDWPHLLRSELTKFGKG